MLLMQLQTNFQISFVRFGFYRFMVAAGGMVQFYNELDLRVIVTHINTKCFSSSYSWHKYTDFKFLAPFKFGYLIFLRNNYRVSLSVAAVEV